MTNRNLQTHLNERSKNWYKFLNSLYSKFSEYGVQNNKGLYNVADVENWGEQGKPQGIEINKLNFVRFLNKIEKYNIAEYGNVKNITVAESELKELNEVINLTIKKEITSFCLSDKLVIKGNFVKFSDFMNIHDKLANLCKNVAQLKSVTIFALNTVFVDRDLNELEDEIELSIIAPKWIIIGNRKITLNGATGKLLDLSQNMDYLYPDFAEKPRNPGLQGKLGGTFFGIGREFHNVANLKIAASVDGDGSGKNRENVTESAIIKNINAPEVTNNINDLAKTHIINEYKIYSRENLNNRFQNIILNRFLEQLDSDPNVKKMYNTLGLVSELQGLEKQFHELNRDVNFLPFYQSLLDRISKYTENPKLYESSDQYKKVLKYLYTATLSKILYIKDNLLPYQTVLVSTYLDLLKQRIEYLKDLEKENDKISSTIFWIDIVKESANNYQHDIQEMIEDITRLTTKQITPQIDNIGARIDNKIAALIDETMLLQKRNISQPEVLIEKKEKLENILPSKALLSTVKIINQMINSFYSIATAVDSTVEGKRGILAGIRLIETQMKVITDIEANRYKHLLERILQEASQFPDKLSAVSVKASDIINKLSKAKQLNEVNILWREMQQRILTTETELLIQQSVTDQKTTDAIALITKYKQFFDFGLTFFDNYIYNKNGKDKVDLIASAMIQKKHVYKQLKEYEDKMYDVVSATLQDMQNSIDEKKTKLDINTELASDITKWHVKSTLKDFKLQMRNLTQGFEVEDEMAYCIRNLEEVTNSLINMYDYIECYQEQKTWTNYIADISSYTSTKIPVDQGLVDTMKYLDITISSYIILYQYQVAYNTFKQFVFPFAHRYIDNSILPSSLELGSNRSDIEIKKLVSGFVSQFDNIISKVEMYKQDACLNKGTFNSSDIQPFFVWKNKQYKSMIADILSGQEVRVSVDTNKSEITDKDSIKFNEIKLNFKVENKSMQSEIDEILKGYQVSLTYLGDSYYRYNNKMYSIRGKSLRLKYSYKDNNAIYDKITNGDFLLSPYASWNIKLDHYLPRPSNSYRDIQKYANEIDLELQGRGSFVYKEKFNCLDLTVDKYFKVVDTYDQTNFNLKNEKTDFASLIQGRSLTRNKRGVSGNTKIVVDQDNQANIKNRTNDSRFSWINSSQQIINYVDYIIREDDLNSSLNLGIGSGNSNNNNAIEAITAVDINGNLTLSQLLAHKIFGSNKALNNSNYVSLQQEQNIRINELASEILPVVNNSFLADSKEDNYTDYYNSAPQWYQNLFEDEPKDEQTKF